MELFAKALEQKPNGVEALTGMGYCHIDAKQFSSAFSKFRAALAVSSRYEPALWGVAEAYQQQGRKEQAIEACKAYLEVYPSAPKAQKAARAPRRRRRRRRPRHRADADADASRAHARRSPPTPPANPTPAPAPAEPPASGSG